MREPIMSADMALSQFLPAQVVHLLGRELEVREMLIFLEGNGAIRPTMTLHAGTHDTAPIAVGFNRVRRVHLSWPG